MQQFCRYVVNSSTNSAFETLEYSRIAFEKFSLIPKTLLNSTKLQGPIHNGPPKEITIYLSYVAAPRLAKRPTDSNAGTADEVVFILETFKLTIELVQPYAWEAREFLRRKVVGKTVVFIRDFIATSGREHG